ncbi:glutathione S-transferase [Stagonosporopsis vannaccii]|nr:glutathione S-transferase [Stagonosporopsis vannaccii]
MLSSYVCRQCRARLHPRRVPIKTAQWQPRATFISLRGKQPQQNVEQNEAQSQSADKNTATESDQPPSYNLFDRSQTSSQSASNDTRRVGRYSRHVRDGAGDAPEPLDAVLPEESKSAEGEGPAHTLRVISRLQSSGLDAAWALFNRIYTSADCEALTNPSVRDIRLINERDFFSSIVGKIVKQFAEGRELAVSPTTALFKYEQLGIASPRLWVKGAIEPLTHQVMLAANGASESPQRDLSSLLSELISVWRLFFQCKGVGNEPLDAISPEWNLPVVDALPHSFSSDDFNYRLQDFHPKCIGSSALGFCAVYMFNLSDAIKANENLRLQASPFLDLLVRVLSGARVNTVLRHPAYSFAFKRLPEDVQVEITKEIGSAPARALSVLGRQQWNDPDTNTSNAARLQTTTDLESFNLKAIARAVESRSSPVVLQSHWKRIVRDYTQNGKISIPPSIYNAFLSGYLVLRQAPRSVEVWNHMISNGVKPEMPTWVAMLEGCEKAKDLDGFNGMWQRMQSAGIEPDNYAWTTRIHGLMSFRQLDLGLRALDEMGKRWRSAETMTNASPSNSRSSKGAKNIPASASVINKCTKPSVEVINGAISGIVQLPQNARLHQQKRIDYVQKILKWGAQFDIKPNTRTFNILIQLYLNASDYATAFKVVKQMELKGVQADISTHTMLITAAFENGALDSLSEADRASRVIQMFEELEAGGMRLNNYVYATAIDRLLKQYGSHSAVRTIVEHMRSRNLSPTAHAYTSLITYYFQQEPPAIAAVDSLLQQIFESRYEDSDKVLFDRTIEGYAAHGEIGKMMSVLTRMSKGGKHPGFRALTAVIKALVAAGDIDRARFIVRDVQRGEGVAKGGVTGAFNDEKHFLDVAEELGIGSEEERMGDAFKMRKDMKALDERIEARLQEEQKAIERQPQPEAAQQIIGAQWNSSPIQKDPEHHMPKPRGLGPHEEDIHCFLNSGTRY